MIGKITKYDYFDIYPVCAVFHVSIPLKILWDMIRYVRTLYEYFCEFIITTTTVFRGPTEVKWCHVT